MRAQHTAGAKHQASPQALLQTRNQGTPTVQERALAGLAEPAGQVVQAEAPARLYVPGSQGRQAVLPSSGA